MAWAEVDLVRRLWTLLGTRTKNGKPHVLQLSDLAVAVIRAQARFTPLVFPAGGGRPVSQFSREKRRLDALYASFYQHAPGGLIERSRTPAAHSASKSHASKSHR